MKGMSGSYGVLQTLYTDACRAFVDTMHNALARAHEIGTPGAPTPGAQLHEFGGDEIMEAALEHVVQGADVNEAAAQIANVVDDPFAFWNKWLDCAASHETAQTRLLALARALQKHHVGSIDDKRLWSDLPRLGWSLRESFEGRWHAHEVYDTTTQPDQFVALSKMYARCKQEQLFDTLPYAVIVFRGVLEQERVPDALDVHLRALSAWTQIAGKDLYNAGKTQHESSALCRGGDLWNGRPGLNQERWSFWKDRLASFDSDQSTDVLALMQAAESA